MPDDLKEAREMNSSSRDHDPGAGFALDDAEALARLIDPSTWRVLDGYLADVKRKYRNENAGYDPEAFRDKKSLALAERLIAVLATRGYVKLAVYLALIDRTKEVLRPFAKVHRLLGDHGLCEGSDGAVIVEPEEFSAAAALLKELSAVSSAILAQVTNPGMTP